jgi:hypothetical protein
VAVVGDTPYFSARLLNVTLIFFALKVVIVLDQLGFSRQVQVLLGWVGPEW